MLIVIISDGSVEPSAYPEVCQKAHFMGAGFGGGARRAFWYAFGKEPCEAANDKK